jgi:hypothetical protein
MVINMSATACVDVNVYLSSRYRYTMLSPVEIRTRASPSASWNKQHPKLASLIFLKNDLRIFFLSLTDFACPYTLLINIGSYEVCRSILRHCWVDKSRRSRHRYCKIRHASQRSVEKYPQAAGGLWCGQHRVVRTTPHQERQHRLTASSHFPARTRSSIICTSSKGIPEHGDELLEHPRTIPSEVYGLFWAGVLKSWVMLCRNEISHTKVKPTMSGLQKVNR